MAKTKISEYDSTAALNTDINSIDIDEGCAPSGINNAIREMMAQLKNFQTGAGGDSFAATQVDLLAQSALRFQDTTGGEYVAFRAPATVATNVTWTLPGADGSNGQFLKTDGSGTLAWADTTQTYPGAGIAVSTGSAWGTSKTAPSGDIVGTSDTQTLTNKTITGTKETKVAIAASDIDLSAGNYFTKTISGATTFTVSNTATTGSVSAFILDLTNGGSATITWFSGVTWAAGTPPTLTASGRDVLGFFTHDAGTTWSGFVLGLAMA